jgi:hypothetical protein
MHTCGRDSVASAFDGVADRGQPVMRSLGTTV